MTKLSKKIKYILAMILSLLFIGSVTGLAFTTARYVSAPSASGDNDGELEFILADVIVVQTVEELMTAIENGYSNIQIAESMPNPFSVYESEMEVTNDLILDLNGHEIQRNSREPMLKIADGVKLTIIDSSKTQTGSLYNPVGSVLNVAGGTLTTRAGSFESGPRKTEYYSNKDESDYTGGIINSTGISSATVTVGSTTATADMPVLLPQTITRTGSATDGSTNTIISGNIYFDEQYDSNNYILADTYLYFVIEGSATTAVSTEAADFSYTYNLKETAYTASGSSTTTYTYEYVDSITVSETTDGSGNKTVVSAKKVTIYGYNNVKTIASDADQSINQSALSRDVSNFAAIKMTSGSLYANGGNYYSYFGEDTAYCVSASGGDLYINDTNGEFEALEEGVCIYCSGDVSDSNISVTAGKFYSYKGSMVSMSGGTMTVTGGTFTKDASAYTATTEGANNAAIDMSGGTLTVTGTDDSTGAVVINLIGSYMDGIRSTGGTVTVENAQFIYNGGASTDSSSSAYSYNVGIANKGGTVTTTDCLFSTNDANSTGIKSELGTDSTAGTVTANGCYFALSGAASTGINAAGGTITIGDASDTDTTCVFYIDHVENCYGIYAKTESSSTELTININIAQFIMGQKYYSSETTVPAAYTSGSGSVFNGAGVYMNASGGALNLQRASFLIAGSYTAGTWIEAGAITQTSSASSGYTVSMLVGTTHSDYSGAGKYTSTSSTDFYENKFGADYFVLKYGVGNTTSYGAVGSDDISTYYYSSGSSLVAIGRQYTGLSATGTAIGSYGIYSAATNTTDTITLNKFYVALCSTYGAGIYTSGGTMAITNFEADIRSTDSSSTTYPNMSTLAAAVSSAAIASRDYSAANAISTASVTIATSTVNTDAYGYDIAVGTLRFTGESTLYSVRSTAIYVSGADLEIDSGASLTVTSNIAPGTSTYDWVSGTKAYNDLLTDYRALSYNSTDSTNANYIQPDGIYISGGALNAQGDLNVTFSGVNNNTGVNYESFNITSYAVRVAGDDSYPTVTITSGAITSSVGGGINVAAAGATVTLGVTDADDSALTVKTTGYGSSSTDYSSKTYYGSYDLSGTNWVYRLYPYSGHAVRVKNGNVTINSGTYYAAQGNGVYVDGSSSVVTIYDGIYVGLETHLTTNIGPAISYAIKLLDGTITVYGGDIGSDGTNSGNAVFVMSETANKGTDATQASDYYCQAYFLGGTYTTTTGRTITVIGYCSVEIGDSAGNSPTITGSTYAIGLEAMSDNVDNSNTSRFVMYSGTISATTDAIWVGNKLCTIDILGGSITGNSGNAANTNDYNGVEFAHETESAVTVTGATISGVCGIYFKYATSGVITIGSDTTDTSISATAYGIRFGNTIGEVVNIAGDSGGTYTTTIYGASAGIIFNGTIGAAVDISYSTIYGSTHGINVGATNTAAITIRNSTVYAGYGVYITKGLSNNFTISGSTVYATAGGSGIEFLNTNAFAVDNYTFTIDSSTVYGGVGVRFYNSSGGSADTGSYGTLKICNGSVISDQSGYNYQGLQFSGDMGMALVIDGSSTEVYGAQRAIQAASTVTGSITVTGGAKLYNDVTSTNNTVINIVGALSGSISVTDSTLTGTNYGIYLTAASTGSISLSNSTLTCGTYGIYYVSTNTGALSITNGSAITATSNNALYFADEMSGALTVTSSTITSNYNAIHFAAAASGAITISGGTITSTNSNGINFVSTVSGGLTITNSTNITAGGYGIYVESNGGISSDITITNSTIEGTTAGLGWSNTFATGSYALTIDSSTITGGSYGISLLQSSGQNGEIIIKGTSSVTGTTYYGIYSQTNTNIDYTISDSATVTGGTYAIYFNNFNQYASVTLYSGTALVSSGSSYQIYIAGTHSGGITVSSDSVVVYYAADSDQTTITA